MGLAQRPRLLLYLDEPHEIGLPAFFCDYGETLPYLDGELFDLRGGGAPWQGSSRPRPLPRQPLENGETQVRARSRRVRVLDRPPPTAVSRCRWA